MAVKKIKWEIWNPPEEVQQITPTDFDFDEDLDTDELIDMAQSLPIQINPINTILTPLGEYHADDPFLPHKIFKCWIGRTNFDLTEKEYLLIEEAPGVEAFRMLSRYRFFIGVGELFTDRDVLSAIESRLIDHSNVVRSAYYIKDGKYEYLHTDRSNLKQFNTLIQKLKDTNEGSVVILQNKRQSRRKRLT